MFVRLAFAANFRAEHSERSFDDEAWNRFSGFNLALVLPSRRLVRRTHGSG